MWPASLVKESWTEFISTNACSNKDIFLENASNREKMRIHKGQVPRQRTIGRVTVF